ncbi:hypothetical protein AMTRI_Chr04g187680 [Amborella trichopoda]
MPARPGTVVQEGNLPYQNLFDAILDAMYSALEKVGANTIDIVVSASGWPTERAPAMATSRRLPSLATTTGN